LMQFYSFLVGLWRLSVYRRCNVFWTHFECTL